MLTIVPTLYHQDETWGFKPCCGILPSLASLAIPHFTPDAAHTKQDLLLQTKHSQAPPSPTSKFKSSQTQGTSLSLLPPPHLRNHQVLSFPPAHRLGNLLLYLWVQAQTFAITLSVDLSHISSAVTSLCLPTLVLKTPDWSVPSSIDSSPILPGHASLLL